MKGFKDFLMQGNLIELATAVIIGAAFGDVVKTFTKVLMDFIGLVGGQPNFDEVVIPGVNINIGVFLTSLVSFVILAAVVYFFVIKPYTHMKEMAEARLAANKDEEAPAPTTDELLAQIRDLLAARGTNTI